MRGGAGRASFRGLPQLTRPGAAACVAASGALAKSTRRALAARDKWGSRSPTIGARDRCGRSEMAPGMSTAKIAVQCDVAEYQRANTSDGRASETARLSRLPACPICVIRRPLRVRLR